jgi:hypothetical protein
MRSKLLIGVLCLFVLTPLVKAEWVRFEAEDAILSDLNAEIQDYADASGGKAVFLTNNPAGTIDFVVNLPDANSVSTVSMRIAFYSNDNVSQKYDSIYVNGVSHIDQNWGCGYYWEPIPKPANFEDYRDSIAVYGSEFVFQILSRWWPAWNDAGRNLPMTIPLVAGKNIVQIQSGWSYTTYDYIELDLPAAAFNPNPADGDTEVRSTQTTLSWENPAGVLVNKVYFGQSDTEPNFSNYTTLLTTVIDVPNPGAAPSIPMPAALEDGKNYYWLVDGDDTAAVMPAEPNMSGVFWHFATQFNAAPVVTIEQPYPYLVGGQAVITLDAAVVDEGPITSYTWTQLAGPATAVIHSADTEDTTVTVIEEAHDPQYQFQLTVSDGSRTGSAVVIYHVHDTACEAALRMPDAHNAADLDYNCLVNMSDFAMLARDWLNCLDTLTGNNCN